MRTKIVFAGPSLFGVERGSYPDVVFLPPAVQGSIVFAVREFDPKAILVVDGGFQSEPAVRHKEILWAISRGVALIGAASMGALRAAELFPHMQGVGLIYRWYRRYAFAPDDAVAVLHGPEETGFAPLTEALVDLRRSFAAARASRRLRHETCTRLLGAASALNFRDRTLSRVIADALPGEQDTNCATLSATLQACHVDQKKKDAVTALQVLQSENYDRPSRGMPFVQTVAFARDLRDAGLAP